MKSRHIVIFFASTTDDLARSVRTELMKRGRCVRFLDENDLFSATPFVFQRTGKKISGYLSFGREEVPIGKISSAFVRLPREWWPGGSLDIQDQMFVYHETTAAWFNFLTYLPCPIINRFSLGWWLQDLNYPLLLGTHFSEELNIPIVPLEPSISYGVRLLPTKRDVTSNVASIYLVGKTLVAGANNAKAILPLLRRQSRALARWQRTHDVLFCRLDFELKPQLLLKYVETFPLFQEEPKTLVKKVVSALADMLL
jgi:hypothetical protein